MYLQGIKLVTFDATNTLLKFRIPPWEYYATVARNFGYNGSGLNLKNNLLHNYKVMWEKHPNFGKNSITWYPWWSEVVKKTFHNQLPCDINVSTIAQTLIEEYKTTKCWCKANGCDDLIKFLQNEGHYIGVISNFDPRLHNILNNINIGDSFNFVLTSYETGFCKPDKRIFHFAQTASREMLHPHECLHIGDDFHKDFKGAIAAGWQSILITETIPDVMNTMNIKRQTFKTLEELHQVLLNQKTKNVISKHPNDK